MSHASKKSVVGSFAILLVIVGTVVGFALSDGTANAQVSGSKEVAGETARTVSVEVVRPEQRPLTRKLALPASFEAWESADLFAKASGYIEKVKVDIGDRVSRGDAMIVISVPEMQDELAQAQAVLGAKRAKVQALMARHAQARSTVQTARAEVESYTAQRDLHKITLDRQKQLFDERAIPQHAYDEAKSHFSVAESRVRTAEAKVAGAEAEEQFARADIDVGTAEVAVQEAAVARLETLMQYATIVAPFDGVVTRRRIDPGDFVRSAAQGASMSLLTVARTETLRLVLNVPESDCRFAEAGTPIDVRFPDHDEPLATSISRTAAALDTATRTMRVEADVANEAGTIAPGMYAHAIVSLETKEVALMIPSKAVRVRGEAMFVLVADGTQARSVDVTVGYDDGTWTEILKGVDPDDRIIVGSGGVVSAGAEITVVEASS